MKYLKLHIVFLTLLVLFIGCDNFLSTKPSGTLSEDDITDADNVDGLVTAAYAAVGNDDMIGPKTSMWGHGSVRSDNAYKGGGGVSDVIELNWFEQYNLTRPDMSAFIGRTWENGFNAISRANVALRALKQVDEGEFPLKNTRIAEMRFLRGHMYFVLKRIFKFIPYIDETRTNEEIENEISNVEFTNDELWDKIGEDFDFAYNNLPESQQQVGRPNRYAAAAYLAKVRLYQAYEQDENHQVVNINQDKLQEVLTLTEEVMNSMQYDLHPDFALNFLPEGENGVESIWAVQYSINDGTSIGRINMETGLNYPLAPQYGCCGFHVPSDNMVNAFKTSNEGLPLFDTYNNEDPSEINLDTVPIDPRVDHTVGIDGHPYKYANEPDRLYSNNWARVPGVYGVFSTMKEIQLSECECFKKEGPFIGTSVNVDIIRYADVLLWRAEALIETGQHAAARPLINQIRARAANSTDRTQLADGSDPSNYNISQYDGSNMNWTQANAREALRWERRLEFAMEGKRFFDLVRWGIAEETLNQYLQVEKDRRSYLQNADFTEGRDEYYPIPQREIDFTEGLYEQNPGY